MDRSTCHLPCSGSVEKAHLLLSAKIAYDEPFIQSPSYLIMRNIQGTRVHHILAVHENAKLSAIPKPSIRRLAANNDHSRWLSEYFNGRLLRLMLVFPGQAEQISYPYKIKLGQLSISVRQTSPKTQRFESNRAVLLPLESDIP